ncbi:hypothetical protein [Leifsonia soli]|uniref:Uncharacterized protein n=1 Tax=Leifsonia soli TaxID=582665 RepID=A0A852T464_9MICO|nr:hypothetical protein [Leifsonia soli]NYD75671.1 hypothetical protein [Leifsonia soli]
MAESLAPPFDQRVAHQMTSISSLLVAPGQHRAYDIILEEVNAFVDLFDFAYAARAYRVWTAITDLVSAPGGPGSDELCELVAREAATDWLVVDVCSRESIDAYFDRWAVRTGLTNEN